MRPSLSVLLAAAAVTLSACTAAQGAPADGPLADSATPTPAASVPAADPTAGEATAGEATASTMAVPPSPTTSAPSSASPAPTPSSVIDPEAIGSPAPVESLILGDSISLSIADDLAGYGYPVIGLVGQSATSGYLRQHLSGDLAQSARTWVILLGTNNSGSPADVAQLPALVDLVDSLRTPGAKQQVRWVTPHRPAAYIGTKTAYTLDAFNAELSRLAGENRWLRILDFDVLAKAHPEWFDADTAMHLHPDAAGQAALVALITGPAPAPAASRAPILSGAATPDPSAPEPETFDNSTMPATPGFPPPGNSPTPAPGSEAPVAAPPASPSPDPAATASASPAA